MPLDETQRANIEQALRGGQTPWDAVGEFPMTERDIILLIWDDIDLSDKTGHIQACKVGGRTPKDAARLLYLDLKSELLPIWRSI